ncbi:hypothetical protein Lal_00032273 [Lupinus albus]|nr:hypothetical protein Lal_00032273 [Lupinus albus]
MWWDEKRDPKVGGGVGRIREVAKNRTPILTKNLGAYIRGSQSLLPYAIFITKILEHFGVSLDGETKVALNLRESKVDVGIRYISCHSSNL